MRTAIMPPEDRYKIYEAYKRDPIIKQWIGLMAHAMAIAPVQYVIAFDNEGKFSAEPILDEWTQKKLDYAEGVLKEYCKSKYPELYETTV